ncbi:MAG: restriction endonuclease [Clostridia bacterium]|nr:restriction endonuclease [Clostridia bacterium]
MNSRFIYEAVLDAMDKGPLLKAEIVKLTLDSLALSKKINKNELKSHIESAINNMLENGVLEKSKSGYYRRNSERPVSIRIERCEEEILKLLSKNPLTKDEIREKLVKIFRTDTTITDKDDLKLTGFMGQILKRLVAEKAVRFDGSIYSVAPAKTAELHNRAEIIALMADFLALLHSKGGEFFERYFMSLLAKYLIRCGKTVIESKTTGGAEDGGIDGIAKTVDSLGFRETIMVQTKNRQDLSTETEVRGFYGAVCANQGSRGIFVTSSDFHPMAQKFLDSIDNCVGINGEKIFAMATDTSYGIKREGGKLTIDRKVL